MKEGIHPNYQPVVFVDANTGKEYITRSTKSSAEKKTIDGVEDGQAASRGYGWPYRQLQQALWRRC